MNRLLLALLGVVLLAAGCSTDEPDFTVEERDGVTHAINRGTNVWPDTAAAPLQFTREQTYGTNEGPGPALLGTVRGVAVDSGGTVYVLDGDNHRLVAFNPDGTVQWSGGRQGEGPGEFQNPSGMILRHERLYVANQFGRQIDVWMTGGDFVTRHTFQDSELSLLNLVGFAEGFLIASETGFGDESQRIHTLHPGTWNRKHSFSLNVDLDLPEQMGFSAQTTTIDNHVFVSHVTEYTLDRYTLDGALTRRIQRDVDSLTGPGVYESGGRSMISGRYSGLGAPVQLAEGHLLVSAFWPTNVDDPDAHLRRSQNNAAEEIRHAAILDLFAPNGRYVGSLRWEGRSSPPMGDFEVVGPNGKLYTTTTAPFPQVRRYEVTVEGL